MYIFFIIIHVLMCLVLIFVVLLQAGRGGGFSEMLGGGQPQSLFGTQTNQFMTRATEVCAVVFIITSLSLGIMSTQRGKSLIEKRRQLQSVKNAMPRIPLIPSKPAAEAAAPVKAAVEKAIPAATAPKVEASQTAVPAKPASVPAAADAKAAAPAKANAA